MQTYVVRFSENERDDVLTILSRSNDIIINKIEPASVGFTIQLDDSDDGFMPLLERMEHELGPFEVEKHS